MMDSLFFTLILSCFIQYTLTASKFDGAINGWDYLLDKPRQAVFKETYVDNSVTSDGKFLIPDCMSAQVNTVTSYETVTDIIESGKSYKSYKSSSLRLGSGVNFTVYNICVGFSYSDDYVSIQNLQKSEKSVAVRVSFMQNRYTLFINKRCPLNEFFVQSVADIAKYIKLNDTPMANYLAQELIKEYGTHTTSVAYYGGTMYKYDYLRVSYWESMKSSLEVVKKAAVLSFLKFINLDASAFNVNAAAFEMYNRSITTTQKLLTLGGNFSPNMKFQDWLASLDSALAIINREGSLLSNLIIPESFPTIPPSTLSQIRKLIEKSILSYLLVNTRQGCMDRSSKAFDFSANFHDTVKCQNITDEPIAKFGGIYGYARKCKGHNLFTGKCNSYYYDEQSNNFYTLSLKCPDGYKAYEIITKVHPDAYDFWHFGQCMSNESDPLFNGMFFGGIYSTRTNNPVTGDQTCPPHFTKQNILEHESYASICVSNDEKLAEQYAVPFGGIFSSCSRNNPWTNSSNCPNGFRRYFAFSINIGRDVCEIYYCTKLKVVVEIIPEIISLPLIDIPDLVDHRTDQLISHSNNLKNNHMHIYISIFVMSYLIAFKFF